MTYVNLPPSLYDIVNTINDRITRLESAPSGPQDTADAAQVNAVYAQAQATQAIAQATLALQNADAAAAQAISAQYTAGVALQSANNKNTTNYYTSAPTTYQNNLNGSTPVSGDIWFVVNASSGYVLYQYVYSSGSGWVNSPITDTVIANLNAGKITAGTVAFNVGLNNGSGTFYVDTSGNLTATSATITGRVTATSGTFTGTVYASSGTFTGSVYASTGTIGGFTIASTYLNYGSTYFYSGGSGTYALVDNSRSISANQLIATGTAINSITTSGGIFAGSTSANSISTSGGLNVSSVIYANGLGTTGSGLPVYQVQTGGNAGYLKVYTSAKRFKKNITLIDSTGYSSIIDNIQPVTYDEIDDPTHTNIPGLIAEDLEQVKGVESLVVYNEEGQTIGINYDKLGVMLVLALKELKQEINTRLDKLEGK